MSAWIVSKSHIDVLVQAMGRRELLTVSPDEAGQMLWQENHRSVNYRYDEDTLMPAYSYAAPPVAWTADELLNHLHCYDYQTCEHEGWQNSAAYRLCKELEQALNREGASENSAEYAKAPWGVPDCGHRHPSWQTCEEVTA